jgi:hypothetical protein
MIEQHTLYWEKIGFFSYTGYLPMKRVIIYACLNTVFTCDAVHAHIVHDNVACAHIIHAQVMHDYDVHKTFHV